MTTGQRQESGLIAASHTTHLIANQPLTDLSNLRTYEILVAGLWSDINVPLVQCSLVRFLQYDRKMVVRWVMGNMPVGYPKALAGDHLLADFSFYVWDVCIAPLIRQAPP